MRDSAIDLSEPKKVEILANRPRCPNRGSSARYSVRSASTGSTAVANTVANNSSIRTHGNTPIR